MLPKRFDYIIAKDVLEHMDEDESRWLLKRVKGKRLFVIVPLGDGERYNIPIMELDRTHVIRQPLKWWINLLEECGWKVIRALTRIEGMKEAWKDYKDGHGFILAKREE